MTLLAKRYATALFALAKDKGAVDAIASDLSQLHGELHAPHAAALLISPDVHVEERQQILNKLTAGRHELVANLVGVLQHRRRLEVLAERGFGGRRIRASAERRRTQGPDRPGLSLERQEGHADCEASPRPDRWRAPRGWQCALRRLAARRVEPAPREAAAIDRLIDHLIFPVGSTRYRRHT
jgi:hypothetical protein